MRVYGLFLRAGILSCLFASLTSEPTAQGQFPPVPYPPQAYAPSTSAPVTPYYSAPAAQWGTCPGCNHCSGSKACDGSSPDLWSKLSCQFRRHMRWDSHLNTCYETCPPPCDASYGYIPTCWRRLPEEDRCPPKAFGEPGPFEQVQTPPSAIIPAPAPTENAQPKNPEPETPPKPKPNRPYEPPPPMEVQFKSVRVGQLSNPVSTMVYRTGPQWPASGVIQVVNQVPAMPAPPGWTGVVYR